MKKALEPLDLMVTERFIPTSLSRLVNDQERALLALPCRFGGLGLVVPIVPWLPNIHRRRQFPNY